jgi:hypothetical protein
MLGLLKAAKVLTACFNSLLGDGSASTEELRPLNERTMPPSVPYFDPQPQSLVITVGPSPIAKRLYLLEKAHPDKK